MDPSISLSGALNSKFKSSLKMGAKKKQITKNKTKAKS